MCKVLCLGLVGSALIACTNGNGGSADGGVSPDGGGSTDGGARVCREAGVHAARAGVAPVGRKIAAGNELSVRGVTSDGFVVYSDDAGLRLRSVALPGGEKAALEASHDLGALGTKFWVTVIGDVVFTWAGVSQSDVGELRTWTARTGLHTVANASFGLLSGVSSDGGRVLYVDGVDPTGTTGDVMIANLDGSGAAKLVSGAHLQGCFPQLGFVGDYAVVTHCDAPPTGNPSATVSSFALTDLRRMDLMTHAANYWSGWSTGDAVLLSTKGGVLTVPVAGGTARVIDRTGFIGQLSRDGATAYYSTMLHAFRRSSVQHPAPVTLVPNDFGGLYQLSGDEAWALYYWTMGTGGSDLYVAPTTQPGHVVTLSSRETAMVVGDGFTADSSHALFLADVDPCTNSGTLDALAVGASGPVVLARDAWSDHATTGANVLLTANFDATGGARYGRADLEYVNTSKTDAPRVIVPQADAVVALSPGADQVVYSWSARPGANAGIYVAPLPKL